VATPYPIRPLDSLADHEQVVDVEAAAFGWDEPRRDAAKRRVPEHYADPDPRGETFGAFAEERLIAFGAARYARLGVYLDGAVTLPDARGSGAYRALVRARWDEAVRRGTPVLVTHALATSEPILERLGFETICELQFLQDSC
jgi:hypothetical protein